MRTEYTIPTRGDGGHVCHGARAPNAAVQTSPRGGGGGQACHVTLAPCAAAQSPTLVDGGGPSSCVTQKEVAASATVGETIAVIRQLWRRRQRWHQAEKSLTLQCSAICRGAAGGSKTEAAKMLKRIEDGNAEPGDMEAMVAAAPLLAARGVVRAERQATEKALAKLARRLPVYPWAKAVYGFGDLGLAAIVGEAGDVGTYKSVAALWKRMGLAVLNGERQRKRTGDAGLEHGYSPRRRSVMWNIGSGLIGCMGRGPRLLVGERVEDRDDLSPYQRLFVERMRYEAERNPEMRREPTTCPKTGLPRESFSVHAANRAKRYVEKRFLRDLYAEWRAAIGHADPTHQPPPAKPFPG